MKNTSLRATLLTALFFFAQLPRVLHHSIWRDEAQAWQIARGTASLADLSHNLRYEGHPLLWYLCLWVIQRFTSDVVAMGVFSLLVSTLGVYLICRFSPFSWLEKILIALGYYFAFEYTLIARSYGLGALLAIAFCAVEEVSVPLACLILGLLANTSIFGTILSFVLLGCLFARQGRRKGWLTGGVVYLALFFCAAWVMRPAPDVTASTAVWHMPYERYRLQGSLIVFASAMLPIPPSAQMYWGSSVLDGLTNLARVLALVGVLGAMSAVLARSKPALIGLWVGFAGILEFTATRYIGYIRHYGQFWILFLCLAWIALRESRFSQSARVAFAALLVLQAFSGIKAWSKWENLPFSRARETAEWLKTEPASALGNTVSVLGLSMPTLFAYLDHPLHEVEPGWDKIYLENKVYPTSLNDEIIESGIRDAIRKNGQATVVFSGGDRCGPDAKVMADLGLHLLRTFGPSLSSENFCVLSTKIAMEVRK